MIAAVKASKAAIVSAEPSRLIKLAASIESAVAIKPTATIKSIAIKSSIMVETRPVETTEPAITIKPVKAIKPIAVEPLKTRPETKSTVEIKRAIVCGVNVVKVVPGTSADKHSIHKPVWAVIAIRRAAKRIRGIKAPLAYRRRIVNPVRRTYLYPN